MPKVTIRVEVSEEDAFALVHEWLNHEPSMVVINTTGKPIDARLTYVKAIEND